MRQGVVNALIAALNEIKEKIYDEMCRLLTEFEEGYLDISEGEDAEELYRMLCKIQNNWEYITAQSTIDPVRRGKWLEEPNCWFRCSSCGEHYPSMRGYMNYNYCPNCGAKMERSEE